jgi:hypothetical protein
MASRLLLKTTIGTIEDDWNISRFSLLQRHLASVTDAAGNTLYAVTAKDRIETQSGDDADIEQLARGAYDQLWLFAVDVTGALTGRDVDNIAAFYSRGGGVFVTRDHQDLGACLTRLGPLGATQYFHTANPDPDPSRRHRDDVATPSISWPNFHSGANGDLQVIDAIEPLHPLMRRTSGAAIRHLPAHPHEGAVGVPRTLEGMARVVAEGRSLITNTRFNLCVVVAEPKSGRAVSDSSFHHLCDYNWNPRMGAPSFVGELPGDTVLREPEALADVHRYAENIAAWLDGRS